MRERLRDGETERLRDKDKITAEKRIRRGREHGCMDGWLHDIIRQIFVLSILSVECTIRIL